MAGSGCRCEKTERDIGGIKNFCPKISGGSSAYYVLQEDL